MRIYELRDDFEHNIKGVTFRKLQEPKISYNATSNIGQNMLDNFESELAIPILDPIAMSGKELLSFSKGKIPAVKKNSGFYFLRQLMPLIDPNNDSLSLDSDTVKKLYTSCSKIKGVNEDKFRPALKSLATSLELSDSFDPAYSQKELIGSLSPSLLNTYNFLAFGSNELKQSIYVPVKKFCDAAFGDKSKGDNSGMAFASVALIALSYANLEKHSDEVFIGDICAKEGIVKKVPFYIPR